MILVNIHRLSQTIPLQSGEKSGKAAYFLMLTLTIRVFSRKHICKEGIKQQQKLYQSPKSLLDVKSQNLTP